MGLDCTGLRLELSSLQGNGVDLGSSEWLMLKGGGGSPRMIRKGSILCHCQEICHFIDSCTLKNIHLWV